MPEKYWVYQENVQATIKLTGKLHVRDRSGHLVTTIELSERPPQIVPVEGCDYLLSVGETYSIRFNLDLPVEGPGASNDG